MLSEAARTAFIFSQSVAAMAESMGMHVANAERYRMNCPPAYSELQFDQVIDRYHLRAEEVKTFLETGEWPQ